MKHRFAFDTEGIKGVVFYTQSFELELKIPRPYVVTQVGQDDDMNWYYCPIRGCKRNIKIVNPPYNGVGSFLSQQDYGEHFRKTHLAKPVVSIKYV